MEEGCDAAVVAGYIKLHNLEGFLETLSSWSMSLSFVTPSYEVVVFFRAALRSSGWPC